VCEWLVVREWNVRGKRKEEGRREIAANHCRAAVLLGFRQLMRRPALNETETGETQ